MMDLLVNKERPVSRQQKVFRAIAWTVPLLWVGYARVGMLQLRPTVNLRISVVVFDLVILMQSVSIVMFAWMLYRRRVRGVDALVAAIAIIATLLSVRLG